MQINISFVAVTVLDLEIKLFKWRGGKWTFLKLKKVGFNSKIRLSYLYQKDAASKTTSVEQSFFLFWQQWQKIGRKTPTSAKVRERREYEYVIYYTQSGRYKILVTVTVPGTSTARVRRSKVSLFDFLVFPTNYLYLYKYRYKYS